MSNEAKSAADRALVARWRAVSAGLPAGERPDASVLAAYAEGSCNPALQELVEAWLAADPMLLDAVLAARSDAVAGAISSDVIRRAQALVGGTIIPFATRASAIRSGPARPRPVVQAVFAWTALAASVALVSYAGFSLGAAAQESIETSTGAAIDLIDQAGGSVG